MAIFMRTDDFGPTEGVRDVRVKAACFILMTGTRAPRQIQCLKFGAMLWWHTVERAARGYFGQDEKQGRAEIGPGAALSSNLLSCAFKAG